MTIRHHKARGTSLIELLISIAILALVIGIVLPAMIYYARVSKSLRVQQRMQSKVNLFSEEMNLDMARIYEINLVSDIVIRYASHESEFVADATQPTGWRYDSNIVSTTLVYRDEDDDPDTIEDNYIEIQQVTKDEEGTTIEERNEVFIHWLSPLEDDDGDPLPIFTLMNDGERNYVILQARMGDRVPKRKELTPEEKQKVLEDDALTGPGYQGLVIQYMFVPHQRTLG